MKSEIQIRNEAEVCQIDIEGTIGVPEEWQFEKADQRVATYEKFRETVREIAQIEAPEVVVNIRSTGGDVNDALLIYDALRSLQAKITTRCYGYTASAATIIAQAASEGRRQIAQSALYLIHDSICVAEGNAQEIEAKVEMLRKTDERIAGIYSTRAGRPVEEFAELMGRNNGNGKWMSPEEVIEAGLADTLVEDQDGEGGRESESLEEPEQGSREGASGGEESQEEPHREQKGGVTRNVASGWCRLLEELGWRRKAVEKKPEAERNVLHFAEDEARWTSRLAAAEERRKFKATRVEPCQDPSYGDTLRSSNERAYAEDVKCFRSR